MSPELVESHSITIYSRRRKTSYIALTVGWQECNNYLLLHSLFTSKLESLVFPIQSGDVCFKMRLIRGTTCKTLCIANATDAVCAFSVTQVSEQNFSRSVEHIACKVFCLSWIYFSMLFLFTLFKNFNLCTSYVKQIMNMFLQFVEWKKYFLLVKDEMFHSTRLHLV